MPKQAQPNVPQKALKGPEDVFNQLAQGGSTVPLFRSLAQVGITRPEEQKLFFAYARQHGGYDAATGDFVIPKEKAVQLWNQMQQDTTFQTQLNQLRIKGIDEGLNRVANTFGDPSIAGRLRPEEKSHIQQSLDFLTKQKAALMENTRRLMGVGMNTKAGERPAYQLPAHVTPSIRELEEGRMRDATAQDSKWDPLPNDIVMRGIKATAEGRLGNYPFTNHEDEDEVYRGKTGLDPKGPSTGNRQRRALEMRTPILEQGTWSGKFSDLL